MIDIIKERLSSYAAANPLELENALKEIVQEIALYGLWRAGFFRMALFQGGTSLRILHSLPRFSEDLDFILRTPDSAFAWPTYLETLVAIFKEFGIDLSALPKEKMDGPIRQAVLKDTSLANQLDLSFASTGTHKTIKIKLEIDTNPPAHSGETTTFLDFPLDYEVRHQDLPSNFSLKIHALLCRGFLKGRDWYDFFWYVAKGVVPNLAHLRAALVQAGPWAAQDNLSVDLPWLENSLGTTIKSVDWREAASDVRRFVKPAEFGSLDLWSEDFFLAKLQKLTTAMAGSPLNGQAKSSS